MLALEPYLAFIKAFAIAALMASLFLMGYHTGTIRTQAQWDAAKVEQLEAEKAARAANEKRVHDLIEFYNDTAREVEKSHAQEIDKINSDLADVRGRINAAGGLRVPGRVCATFAARPEAAGAGNADATGAGTVALPQPITDDLLGAAHDADEVSARLRGLQDWVKRNGFYKEN